MFYRMHVTLSLVLVLGAVLGAITPSSALAQQKNANPQNGTVLPQQEPPFPGKIGCTVKDSRHDFPK